MKGCPATKLKEECLFTYKRHFKSGLGEEFSDVLLYAVAKELDLRFGLLHYYLSLISFVPQGKSVVR